MKAYFRIPLIFLLVGATLGILLRWQFISPFKFLKFSNWLHAHSHVMFLGWITNFLLLAFIYVWMKDNWSKGFRTTFIFMQVLIVGMIISFPIQGYGMYSIILLSLHILATYFFCIRFIRLSGRTNDQGLRFVKISLGFLMFSSLGAFAMGPIAAMGLIQSKWYYFAILFYLHFQYNGFFIFGIFGLFFQQMKAKGIELPVGEIKKLRLILFYACFPAYLLSVLWSDGGIVLWTLAIIAALMQMYALVIFFRMLFKIRHELQDKFSLHAKILLGTSFISFCLKIVLQLLSAIPEIAKFAPEVRFFVLAYLHLVLIGTVSFYLLSWLLDSGLARFYNTLFLLCLVFAFIVTEIVMVATPLFGSWFQAFTVILFLAAVLMAAGFSSPLFSFLGSAKHDSGETLM